MEYLSRGNSTRILSLWILLMGSFNITGLSHSPVAAATVESVNAVKVSAVSGGEAILPCDTRLTHPTDTLLLVVWYKDDVPIYSYDGRVKEAKAHWADDVLLGRAFWYSKSPSSLRIRDVLATDRAMYRCRVDFKVSPTRNHKILLNIVELPQKPKIIDENDREVISFAGPFHEDISLKLTCVVSGGQPQPRLRWWRDDKIVTTLSSSDDGSNLRLLELKIPKLTREYLDAVYTCTADNTPLVPPLRVNVQLKLYLRPLQVEIMSREQPLSVGQEAELTCRAIGATPPAVITWWLDGKQLTVTDQQKNSSDGNETISILRWKPRMDHDSRILICRASHVYLKHSTIETTKVLNLHYMPNVALQLGSKLNPNDIEEGDDVYFECIIHANPPPYKVVWEHNGQLMTHNQRAGIIAGSAHLALQGVTREQSGKYVCMASNVEGDGRSPPVNLQVIYKPVCAHATTVPITIGAALNEVVKVVCEVDAYPLPKNFQWILDNKMGTIEMDSEKFTIDSAGRSILTISPNTNADYGSLTCRATNLAGQQTEPCRYNLLPAVKPDPPSNCSARNLTDDSVELHCFAGFDGGLHTIYIVEAWASGALVANSSDSVPVWRLRALGAGRALKVVFYAYNAKGRSDSVMLRIHTLTRLALHTEAKTKNSWDTTWVFGVIIGMGGVLSFIAFLAFLLRKRHRRPIQYEVSQQNAISYKDTTHSESHSPQPDDKNPDVIPYKKGSNSVTNPDDHLDYPPYAVVSPPARSSRSIHSFHDVRFNSLSTPGTPPPDTQSIESMVADRRSATSGTLSRRREIITTRMPLLANAKESCV